MELLKNLKVSSKLLSLAVISFIGFVIVGWFGYTALKSSEADITELYNEELMGMYYIGDSRHAMRQAQIQAVLMQSSHTPELMRSREEKYQAGVKEMEECIVKYEALVAHRPQRMELLNTIKADWAKFKQTSERVMELGHNEDTKDQAIPYYEKECMPIAVKLGTDLAKLQDMALEKSEGMLENIVDSTNAAIRNMTIVVIIIIAVMVVAIITITKGITDPLTRVMHVCGQLRDGDFRHENVSIDRGDEFGDMMRVIADMRETINKLMRKTSNTTEQLAASSEELTASAHQSAQASEQVAQSVTNSASAVVEQQQQVGDAMEAIDHALGSIERLNEAAKQVAEQATATNQEAVEGSKAIESAVNQIVSVERIVNTSAATVDKLGQRSKEIGQIVETISGIADQTNLLALNAAIEAARAGSQGRGFAVVADEVRKLAEESQEAAQRIASLIAGIQNDTDDAVASMHEGSIAVKEGTSSVEQLKETFGRISTATNGVMDKARDMSIELKTVTDDTHTIKDRSGRISENSGKVATEMESVSAASQQQSASAEEIASASDSLAHTAQDLQNDLQQFQF